MNDHTSSPAPDRERDEPASAVDDVDQLALPLEVQREQQPSTLADREEGDR